ncbi:MAG: hypothetical protein HFG20_05805 [Anaerotruncus sp.]|nr:hypothetical protein [Anaerotruncus sp.]
MFLRKRPHIPYRKDVIPIFCQKCLSTELSDPVDQSAVSCEYCGKDLSEAPEGTIICKGCADLWQLCQRCGRPLRLADFKGIFVDTGGARLHRGAEKQIIALLLGRQK